MNIKDVAKEEMFKMKLAVAGGSAAFKKPLYVGQPIVEKKVRDAYFNIMVDVFERNYFTNDGPMVQKLEAEIAKIHQVKHCIAVCNATIGQILVLKALELEGEIILPSFTFISTAHACLWLNLKTVFCDIDKATLTIDVQKAERLITKDTSAIIGVHLFGNICDLKGLENICKKHRLRLIFDAAHAFGCQFGNTPIGSFGNAEIISFHATKFFSTFEGGVILTNDDELGNRLRFLRNFGFRGYDDVKSLGINAKMSESSAAMGLASLSSLASRSERLKNIFSIYQKNISTIPGITLVPVGTRGRSNYFYVVVLVDEKKFGVSRDMLLYVLCKENIFARRYFYPGCHRMEPYAHLYPAAYKRLTITEEVAKKVLCLPSNLEDPEKDINTIASIIKTVHKNAGEIRALVKF